MTTFAAADYPVLAPGVYNAEFVRVEESVVAGPYGHYIDWFFSVETDDGPIEISGRSSRPERLTRTTKARVWLEQILGRSLAKDERVDTSKLAGAPVQLTIGLNDSGQFNRVVAIHGPSGPRPDLAADLPF
jgi:hypothetical protein